MQLNSMPCPGYPRDTTSPFPGLAVPVVHVKTDLFVEYDSAGLVPKWLFGVMMLGKDLIFYGETDVGHRIRGDMQRLWRIEKGKDPSTVPFHHARLPVYSWMSGSVTTNMYHFDKHTMLIGTTNRWDKQVYPPRSLFLTPLSAPGLAHCCTSNLSFFPSHFQLPNYLTYSAGHFEEMPNNNLGGFMPLTHVLWYLDKYLVDCEILMQWVLWMRRWPWPQRLRRREGGRKWRFCLCRQSSNRTLAVP